MDENKEFEGFTDLFAHGSDEDENVTDVEQSDENAESPKEGEEIEKSDEKETEKFNPDEVEIPEGYELLDADALQSIKTLVEQYSEVQQILPELEKKAAYADWLEYRYNQSPLEFAYQIANTGLDTAKYMIIDVEALDKESVDKLNVVKLDAKKFISQEDFIKKGLDNNPEKAELKQLKAERDAAVFQQKVDAVFVEEFKSKLGNASDEYIQKLYDKYIDEVNDGTKPEKAFKLAKAEIGDPKVENKRPVLKRVGSASVSTKPSTTTTNKTERVQMNASDVLDSFFKR